VARKLKNANHPATFRKFFLLILHTPGSFSGGLSCFAFLAGAAGLDGVGGGET
jgi:hypothetical protein